MGKGKPRSARTAPVFRDFDALAYDTDKQHARPGDATAAVNHIAKRRQKNKGAEVVFDAAAHKEYIGGFRRRKQQRRQEAAVHNAKKQRLERNQQRLERRAAFKEELGLGDNFGVEPSSSEVDDELSDDPAAAAAPGDGEDGGVPAGAKRHTSRLAGHSTVQVFDQQGVTTTVTTVDLDPQSEDDAQAGDSGEDDDGNEGGTSGGDDGDGGAAGTRGDGAGDPRGGGGARGGRGAVRGRGGRGDRGIKLRGTAFKVGQPDKVEDQKTHGKHKRGGGGGGRGGVHKKTRGKRGKH